jgi:hypothetical protein
MANFDPAQRVVTALMQQTGKDIRGNPVYKRLPYNYVSYDGAAERVLEPRNGTLGFGFNVLTDCSATTPEQLVGFEFFSGGRPEEGFAYDDFDAAVHTNGLKG